jgi:hypothetical protein
MPISFARVGVRGGSFIRASVFTHIYMCEQDGVGWAEIRDVL